MPAPFTDRRRRQAQRLRWPQARLSIARLWKPSAKRRAGLRYRDVDGMRRAYRIRQAQVTVRDGRFWHVASRQGWWCRTASALSPRASRRRRRRGTPSPNYLAGTSPRRHATPVRVDPSTSVADSPFCTQWKARATRSDLRKDRGRDRVARRYFAARAQQLVADRRAVSDGAHQRQPSGRVRKGWRNEETRTGG